MKDFIKMTLAVIAGIIIVSIVSTVIAVGIAASIGASGKSVAQLTGNSVLKIDLSKITLGEQSAESNPLSKVQGQGDNSTIGILDAVNAINAAAEDPFVKFIFLKTDGYMGDVTYLQELRGSLARFRSSGKPVISYIESPTTGSYYIASVADKVYMTAHPGASPTITGVSTQMVFLKDILDILGVEVQLIRHGRYKSAGETFVRNTPSDDNLLQYKTLVNSIWGSISSEIADSRDITVDDLNSCIDNLKLSLPEDFLDEKLVDELLTAGQLEDKIATFAQVESIKDVKMADFADYVASRTALASKAKNKIAVIYADGDIIDGSESKNVAGDRFAGIISSVRADSSVKAVVLRVNSPGGSVLASEKIKTELDLLKKDKPLIASFGAYAASGGYWISNNCDRIFSNPSTLTGSIGVFSLIPNFGKTARNLAHVNFVTVSSNKHGDMYALMRRFDEDETAYQQRSVEMIYDKFTSMVSEGRNLDKDYVDGIGQGRVWSGLDALSIGLVDEIGSLEDAIGYAAVCAGDEDTANWNITAYPKPQTTIEMLMELFGEKSSVSAMVQDTMLEGVFSTMKDWAEAAGKGKADITFARLPYEISIR